MVGRAAGTGFLALGIKLITCYWMEGDIVFSSPLNSMHFEGRKCFGLLCVSCTGFQNFGSCSSDRHAGWTLVDLQLYSSHIIMGFALCLSLTLFRQEKMKSRVLRTSVYNCFRAIGRCSDSLFNTSCPHPYPQYFSNYREGMKEFILSIWNLELGYIVFRWRKYKIQNGH